MNTVMRLNVSVGLGLIFFGMIFSFLPSAPASAALLQVSFTEAVNDVNPPLFSLLLPAINNGQTLVGSLTIDTSIPDSNPSGPISQYDNAIKSLTLTVGPTNAALVPANATTGLPAHSIQIHNVASFDRYALGGPLTGSSVNGLPPIRFEFDADALPSAPPSLSSFRSNQWRLFFSGAGNPTVRGPLTSLTAVPLPAAVILFGAGLVALAGLGAGSWRHRRTASPRQKAVVLVERPAAGRWLLNKLGVENRTAQWLWFMS